jgi:hypothetical protein
MKPEEIKRPGDVFKHLGDMMKPDPNEKYNLNNFFAVINKAHSDLQELIKPFTCEVCGKHESECECESTC